MVGSKVPIEGLLVLGRIHDRNFGDNKKIGSKSKIVVNFVIIARKRGTLNPTVINFRIRIK